MATHTEFTFDNAVETLAKHLYLSEDTEFNHQAVTWRSLEEMYPGSQNYWRKKARSYLKVAGMDRALAARPSSCDGCGEKR